MTVIISVVNNKGGVGKTIVTCNLADALGRRGKRVLAVDMDSQCNCTSILMPKTVPLRSSLYELLDPGGEDIPLSSCIYNTNYGNVYCLPNVLETAALEPELIANAPQSFLILRNKLRNYIEQHFDFVLIDNPPNMGTFVMCSLYASDFVIVPIKAGSAFSVEGLIRAIKVINDVSAAGNPDLRFLRLLINSIDKRTAVSRSISEHIASTFQENKTFKTMIPINTTFERAEAAGKTIFSFDQTAAGARSFRELARELVSLFDPQEAADGR